MQIMFKLFIHSSSVAMGNTPWMACNSYTDSHFEVICIVGLPIKIF